MGLRHVLIALVVALIIAAAILSPEYIPGCREIGIRWVGAILQLIGFGTVGWGLWKAERQFGRPTLLKRIKGFFAEFPKWRVKVVTGHMSAIEGADFFGHARASVWPAPNMPHDEQLKMIWANLRGLDRVVSETETNLLKAKNELGEQIKERYNELKAGEAQIKGQLEEAFVGGIHIEWWAVILFCVGVALASTSPEIAYLLGFPPGCY